MSLRETIDHDSWRTVAGTGLGYGIVLLVLFVALFVLPFLVFSLL
ncbi:hypothetical protein [Halogranum rubrum]|uniref:Uncharacterized protein n=1 Tax=Halogranum salarium B-1 TaxID=1210908 RepID=J3JGW5_9EURY|nr:hypothetical protein [Halogranum salarium]EJN60484.1 hypothetical protein HSB1_10870 [Halogranum salarium B-1]